MTLVYTGYIEKHIKQARRNRYKGFYYRHMGLGWWELYLPLCTKPFKTLKEIKQYIDERLKTV